MMTMVIILTSSSQEIPRKYPNAKKADCLKCSILLVLTLMITTVDNNNKGYNYTYET